MPWQWAIVRKLFGWKRPDGTRRHRKLWCEVPRKNGKSTFIASIGKYTAWADGEPGAEVYCIAGNVEQARVVFGECVAMATQEPAFDGALEVLRDVIYAPASMSKLQVLTGRARGKHGLNPHGVIGDEVHEWESRDFYEAMQSALGARRQPLELYITTAGASRHSLCYELHRMAQDILAGILDLPQWLVVIFAADPADDWTAEETWKKANPSYGVTVKPAFLEEQLEEARANPAQENTFRRLYLNQWTDALARWIGSEAWNALANPNLILPAMYGRKCHLGLDLAREHDLSALAYWFEPDETWPFWILLCKFWCPADDILKRSRSQNIPYDVWEREGWITTTPGTATDFAYIERDIRRAFDDFDIRQLGYDRTFAGEIVNNLDRDGFPLVQVPQTCLYLGNPTAEMARKVRAQEMRHGANPVLDWCLANTVILTDSSGNQKPDKKRSDEKIDGIAAAVTGLAPVLADPPKPPLAINAVEVDLW